DELGRERRQPLVLKIGPAIVDQEVLLLDIAGLVQAPAESGGRGRIVGLPRAAQKTQHPHPRPPRPCPRPPTRPPPPHGGDGTAPPPLRGQSHTPAAPAG